MRICLNLRRGSSCSLGTVSSAKPSTRKICLSTTVFVESSRIRNLIEISNHTHVVNLAKGREVLSALICALSSVIVENVPLVNMRVKLLNVIAGKLKEWPNAVNKEQFSNAEKNVRKPSNVENTNVKETAIMVIVIHVRKNTWFHVIVAKTKMLLIAIKNLMLVAKSAKNC